MRNVFISEQGVHVHAEGESLLVSRAGVVFQRIRLGDVASLTLCGRVELSSGAIAALAREGTDTVFVTESGRFRARMQSAIAPDASLRARQLERFADPAFSMAIARSMISAKIVNQRAILLRAQRGWKCPKVASDLTRLRALADGIGHAGDPEALLGREGEAAAIYFRHFGRLLLEPSMAFQGRSRRPPLDPPNACMSFGYTLLGNLVESDILVRGLDPYLGVFHAPRHGRKSLALDILEPFRPVVDQLVIRLVNLRQLGPRDFENPPVMSREDALDEDGLPTPGETRPAVYLNASGRKVFVAAFYARLKERSYHPPTDTQIPLRAILTAQVNALARCVLDNKADYQPFQPE